MHKIVTSNKAQAKALGIILKLLNPIICSVNAIKNSNKKEA